MVAGFIGLRSRFPTFRESRGETSFKHFGPNGRGRRSYRRNTRRMMQVLTILQQVGKFARVGLLTVGLWQGAAAAPIKAQASNVPQPMACCCGTSRCISHEVVAHSECTCGCQVQAPRAAPTAPKHVATTVEVASKPSHALRVPAPNVECSKPTFIESTHVITRFANAPPGRSPPQS